MNLSDLYSSAKRFYTEEMVNELFHPLSEEEKQMPKWIETMRQFEMAKKAHEEWEAKRNNQDRVAPNPPIVEHNSDHHATISWDENGNQIISCTCARRNNHP